MRSVGGWKEDVVVAQRTFIGMGQAATTRGTGGIVVEEGKRCVTRNGRRIKRDEQAEACRNSSSK
jgi:hypothetical protein